MVGLLPKTQLDNIPSVRRMSKAVVFGSNGSKLQVIIETIFEYGLCLFPPLKYDYSRKGL